MKTTVTIIIQITMLVFLGIATIWADETKVASVVVEHWPPWEVADNKQKIVTGGLAVDLVQELFNRLNIEMQLKTRPWKRALVEIKNGTSDIIPMVAKDSERGVYMHFTVPIYTDQILLVYSADKFENFQWSHWQDLKPYRLQIVRGYSYGDAWNQAVKKHGLVVKTSTNDIQSIKMLIAGRTDLTPLFYVSGTNMLKEVPGSERLRFSKKPIRESVLYIGVSKKSFLAGRLSEINKNIQDMQDDGSYKTILKHLYRN